MSKYEQIMESGCMEDYRHSLETEGDMTYSDSGWYEQAAEREVDIQSAIELLQNNGYTVEVN